MALVSGAAIGGASLGGTGARLSSAMAAEAGTINVLTLGQGIFGDPFVKLAVILMTGVLWVVFDTTVVNVGLDLGVIPPPVFAMLVIMAIVSTVVTTPALKIWLNLRKRENLEALSQS